MDRIFYDNQEYAKYSDKFLKRFNLADQAAYDALPAATKNDDSKVFFIPDIPEPDYIYKWDFTKSLTDEVSGEVATLSGGLTRDNGGLKFTAAKQIAYLGGINLMGRTIEIDISKFEFKGNPNYHVRLLMNTSSEYTLTGKGALIYRAASSYGYWSAFSSQTPGSNNKWSDTPYNITDVNAFNNKKVKLVFNKDIWKTTQTQISTQVDLYVNNEYKGSTSGITFVRSDNSDILIGGLKGSSSASSGDQCYDMTITGVRIYENEEE